MELLSDNKKIGTFLAALGALFMGLGVLLFFDRGLLAIGNFVFIVGLFFLIGFSRLIQFFVSPRRLRGTVCFFLGVLLILLSWTMVGVVVLSASPLPSPPLPYFCLCCLASLIRKISSQSEGTNG